MRTAAAGLVFLAACSVPASGTALPVTEGKARLLVTMKCGRKEKG